MGAPAHLGSVLQTAPHSSYHTLGQSSCIRSPGSMSRRSIRSCCYRPQTILASRLNKPSCRRLVRALTHFRTVGKAPHGRASRLWVLDEVRGQVEERHRLRHHGGADRGLRRHLPSPSGERSSREKGCRARAPSAGSDGVHIRFGKRTVTLLSLLCRSNRERRVGFSAGASRTNRQPPTPRRYTPSPTTAYDRQGPG